MEPPDQFLDQSDELVFVLLPRKGLEDHHDLVLEEGVVLSNDLNEGLVVVGGQVSLEEGV